MRIIGGTLGGRRLVAPKGLITRPATDRVRESIFNLIAARTTFSDCEVLDLFCGTGALGLESISRGARHSVFVEVRRDVLKVARENANRLDVADHCVFLQRDALKFIRSTEREFDLIFADPPYDLDGLDALPNLAVARLRPEGLLLLEHDRYLSFTDNKYCVDSRAYGRTIVSIFRPSRENV